MDLVRLDLERARRDAKQLLAAARIGDPVARSQLRTDRPPRLADAQHAVATRHGFRTWPALVEAVRSPGAALRRAATRGDDETVRAMLEAGAPPNERDARTGRTALHLAAAADQLDVVAALVGWVPVDARALDRRGRSALDLANVGSPVADVLAACGLRGPRPPIGTDHADLAEAAELALWRHVATAAGVARLDLGAGFAFRTGLDDNSRNGVVCDELPDEFTFDDVRAFLGDVPATWHVSATEAPARALLVDAGAIAERSAVHMVAPLDALAPSLHTDVRGFADPPAHLLDAGEAALLKAAGSPVEHHVLGDIAVATTFQHGTTLLGVHLVVERAHRRRGNARMLVRHVAAQAADRGCTHVVLAPTAATVPLFERLGFRLEASHPDRFHYLA